MGKEAAVELVREHDGASLRAVATAGALLHVHVAGVLRDGDGEIARLALNPLDVGAGEQLDVQVTAHIH